MSWFEHEHTPRLSPEDAALVDRLLGSRVEDDESDPFAPDALIELPDSDRARAEALRALLAQLDRYPVAEADSALVDATLAQVDRVDRDLASLPLREVNETRRRLRFRVPDLVGLAAAILLAVGVLMPVANRVRMARIDARCSDNMRLVGLANMNYANDFDGWLPNIAGILPWDRSSSAENAGLLEDLGYCDHGHIGCPGHHGSRAHRGYAFRAMDHRNRARIALAPQSALASDRSDVLDLARSGAPVINLVIPSANHHHRGQYVLLGTLEVRWTTSPVIPGVHGGMDNVFLIQMTPGTEDLPPGQRTLNPEDHFTH